jgi:hypothetical protein
MKILSVARAKDRETMAARLEAIAVKTGAEIVRDVIMTHGRAIWLHVSTPRGLDVTIDLDGDSGQMREGTFVLAWHMGLRSDDRLTDAFGCVAGGSINPFHRRKCTTVNYGFEAMCAAVEKALMMAMNGEAFEK